MPTSFLSHEQHVTKQILSSEQQQSHAEADVSTVLVTALPADVFSHASIALAPVTYIEPYVKERAAG